MLRHLAPLITVYVLVSALVLVGAPLAAEEQAAPNADPAQPAPEPAPPPPTTTTTTPNPPAAAPPAPAQKAAPPAQPDPAQPEPEAAPVAVAAGPGSVSIADFSFSPGSITVNVGDTVTWTNTGKEGHSATGSGFDSGILAKGESGSHTFSSAGSFSYHCTPHPFMKGTVVVRAASSGGGGASGGGGSSGGGASNGAGSGSAGGSGTSGSAGSTASGSQSAGSSGSALPATGADAAVLGGFGLLLLGLGFAIRRRAASAP